MQSTSIIPEKQQNNNLYKSALVYAKRLNWAVFPLVPKGKNPLTAHGFKDATKDTQQITEFWERWPDANIGIPTGKVNCFFVVDIDPRNGGHESLDELTDKYGQLPDTVEAETGGNGRHILLSYHEGIRSMELAPGIDIKADGGYIVAAPSIHPNGNKYEWELSSRPLEVDIAEPPGWLLDMIEKPRKTEQQRKSSNHWTTIMQGLREGEGRNNAAASLAGHLLRRYCDPSLVVEVLHLWNGRNNPPLEDWELDRTIQSIANAELKRRRGAN